MRWEIFGKYLPMIYMQLNVIPPLPMCAYNFM